MKLSKVEYRLIMKSTEIVIGIYVPGFSYRAKVKCKNAVLQQMHDNSSLAEVRGIFWHSM